MLAYDIILATVGIIDEVAAIAVFEWIVRIFWTTNCIHAGQLLHVLGWHPTTS